MKHLKPLFFLVVVLAALNLVQAQNTTMPRVSYQIQSNGIPAKPEFITYQQPDGSQINIKLNGDAAIHWATSADGYTLLSNVNGFYEYAKLDENNNLISTGIIASDENNRDISEITLLNSIPKGLNFSEMQIQTKLSNYRAAKTDGNSVNSFPPIGTGNFLVLMVQFPDFEFTNSVADFNNLMNQQNYGGIGSFKDFYYQNSYGLLTVNTLVDGIYVASNNHDYYGQNDEGGNDMYVEDLFAEVIAIADDYIDFSQFDNDGDGVADAIYMIYAGTGEASSGVPNDIWPHNNPSITPITVDGVVIDSYTCSNELNGTAMAGIGTICHEFGHALGLPDFYDTDYEGSGGQAEGTGTWDVMCGGNSNGNEASPANHNPLSKQMLGWLVPQTIAQDGTYTLQPATQQDIAFVVEAESGVEGFYLENRQYEGFDYYLQGAGMLIYHADYAYIFEHFDDNNLNADPSHQGFDLEEADNENTDETGDTYPGLTSNTSFTDETAPSSELWSGSNLAHPIVNITENNDDIVFNISGITGINNLNTNSNIQIYPTIANENINIRSSEIIEKIEIINIEGQLISSYIINNSQTQINVSNLENGTYFVKSKTSTNNSVAKIIIIH